jgi:hypothetical protein
MFVHAGHYGAAPPLFQLASLADVRVISLSFLSLLVAAPLKKTNKQVSSSDCLRKKWQTAEATTSLSSQNANRHI